MGENMKQDALLTHAVCDACDQKIGHTGIPLFWRVKVDRFGIDINAVRRQDGLAQYLGSTAIANIMGPDEDKAKLLMEVTLTLCERCAMEEHTIGFLALNKAQKCDQSQQS